MAGLSPTGLSIKRLQEIRDDVTQRLEGFFGNTINTAEDSVFGQVRDSVVPGEASLWEQLQIVYDSQSPSRAEGQQLDDNVAYVGVTRKNDIRSTVVASVTGINNTTLPVGFTVEVFTTKREFEAVTEQTVSALASTVTLINVATITNSVAYTVSINGVDAVFTSDIDATESEVRDGLVTKVSEVTGVSAVSGVASNEIVITADDATVAQAITVDAKMAVVKVTSLITMQAKDAGPIVAPKGTLTLIKTPVSGIDVGVTNEEDAVLGQLVETDSQLRARRDNELAVPGAASVNAIFSRISAVEGVTSTLVLENFTAIGPDGDSVPAHGVRAIVLGGDDKLVAKAIFDSKPVGTAMAGAVSVVITDTMNITRNILFDRPTKKPIFIQVTGTKLTGYPSDGDTQIKDALVQFGVDSLTVGDDVITSRLYTPINSVPGHQVDSLFIGFNASPTASDTLSITFADLADITLANITVTNT